ncbi:hypothetical protein [Klenkia taihuensis]|uniref:Uncharacterized protein n=1 Tax=Klenkia taihuensis TaxID=1225127 RepID=A0A1I1IRJ3_9ACTN|nr:hypothetical protein [Klenkia taihuensis]GHE11304.1 hypothetical protein GCM10011381_24270 [Klenkia taihuensis]SFC38889.1 hypothetical protein SAMN05661030_0846 [Klenkia taihuensis]
MTERGDGGWQTWGNQGGTPGGWQQGPPPQRPGWDGREPTQQFGAVPGPPPQAPPQGAWNPAQGPAPWAPQPPRRSRRTPLLVGGAALLVLLLVGGGLFFLLRGDDLSYAGRAVAEPQQVVDDGEAALDAYVSERGGASSDDTGCWFRFLSPDTSDVQDDLVCGPVLFVDGDPSATYLEFPLTPSGGRGDVVFEVAAEPTSPEPQPLADRELLTRPDGATPPDGAGDLTAPEPRAADPGFTADGPFDDVQLEAPEGPATLSGASARVTVTGLASTDRIGTGDDARRPADGEVFRVFGYTLDRGEGYGDDAPLLSYRVDGGDEVPVDPSLVTPGASVEGLLSVPEDADVQLVVVDGEDTQTLSLVDGSPGPDNLVVTTRENRTADPVAAQQIPGVISAPGRVTTPFTFTVTIQSASLSWYAGTNVTARPSGPDRAFLVIDSDLVADTFSAGEGPPAYFSLTLPDGTVIPSQDIVDDPALVATAFDVPADFTEGTVTFGGVFTYPDGATVDFQPGTLSFPVTVPAG